MRNLKLCAVALCLVLGLNASAQQDAQFSQYMFNGLYYNPGYAGVEKVTRFNVISRVQWLNYDPSELNSNGLYTKGGAPQSVILSANSNLYRADGTGTSIWDDLKLGVGLYLLHETIGPLRNTDVEFSLSKHIDISNGVLGLGLSGGIFSQRLDQSYVVVDPNDQIYIYLMDPNNGLSQTKGDMSAGFWYEHQRYFVGASFNHIPRSKFTYGSTLVSSRLSNHAYLTAGYKAKVSGSLVVTPSFIMQSDLNQLTYLFGALAEYNKKVWFGVHARQSLASREEGQGKSLSNDDIILYIGMHLLKNKKNEDVLRLGYAFDFVTSGVDAKKRTSHELMLSYLIPNPFGDPKPPIRTPRYRHEN